MMQLGLPYKSTHGLDIECLLHVVYESPHLEEITDFFVNTLNFKISDFSGRETNFVMVKSVPLTHGTILLRLQKDLKIN